MRRDIEQLFSLSGRVAIVTGGSRGIGAAIAAAFAGAEAKGVAVARSPASAPGPASRTLTYRPCDVTDERAFGQLCHDVVAEFGRLDILVNAAGITQPAVESPQSSTAFDETLATNLRAPYRCSLAAAEAMTQTGGGTIINVTSINSVLGFPGNPGYVASKGGLRMLSKALAIDLAGANIRVNNLVPGYIRTAMTEGSFADPGLRAQRERHTILGRWGTTNDVVGAAIFLASDASAYITGQDLFVDGGWTAKGLV